jgi:hypothetical protein
MITLRPRSLSLVLVLGLATYAAGCGAAPRIYQPVAQHTLSTGPDADTDVIWVQQYDGQHDSTLLRCHNGPSGPECQAVSSR